MPLDWQDYDAFDWRTASQRPMEMPERVTVEQFAADVLQLKADRRSSNWGRASPPGRFAATVIRIDPDISHQWSTEMATVGIPMIAMKVFKTNRDTQRQVKSLLAFHAGKLARLPGVPHDHLQRVLFAGSQADASGEMRGYLIQEWAPGVTLEQLQRDLPGTVTQSVARSILHQLLATIVARLWSLGTIWWDFRDANYCYDRAHDRSMMIDIDSLAAYADEILERPNDWTQRDKGRQTALARLRQMTVRIALASTRQSRKQTEHLVRSLWHEEIDPVFARLGHSGTVEEAEAYVQRFLDRLFPASSDGRLADVS